MRGILSLNDIYVHLKLQQYYGYTTIQQYIAVVHHKNRRIAKDVI